MSRGCIAALKVMERVRLARETIAFDTHDLLELMLHVASRLSPRHILAETTSCFLLPVSPFTLDDLLNASLYGYAKLM